MDTGDTSGQMENQKILSKVNWVFSGVCGTENVIRFFYISFRNYMSSLKNISLFDMFFLLTKPCEKTETSLQNVLSSITFMLLKDFG